MRRVAGLERELTRNVAGRRDLGKVSVEPVGPVGPAGPAGPQAPSAPVHASSATVVRPIRRCSVVPLLVYGQEQAGRAACARTGIPRTMQKPSATDATTRMPPPTGAASAGSATIRAIPENATTLLTE